MFSHRLLWKRNEHCCRLGWVPTGVRAILSTAEQRKRSCVSLHALLISPALGISEELRVCKVAAVDLTVHGRYKKDE